MSGVENKLNRVCLWSGDNDKATAVDLRFVSFLPKAASDKFAIEKRFRKLAASS